MTARTWRPDGPGSYQAPPGVHAITDHTGRPWAKHGPRWTSTGTHFIRWRTLVADHGPVTETTAHPQRHTEAERTTPA